MPVDLKTVQERNAKAFDMLEVTRLEAETEMQTAEASADTAADKWEAFARRLAAIQNVLEGKA